MQNQSLISNSSEMDLYRYFAGAGGGNDDVFGMMMPGINNCYGMNHRSNNSNYNNNNYSSSCSSFYPATSGLMEAVPESKAIMASRVLHKEAEKRRRERINSHLDRLRSLLPCTTKTDKATLLSKVVQRVVELKRQTSELIDIDDSFTTIPSENDEFAVYIHDNNNDNDNDNDNDNEYNIDDVEGDVNNKQLVLRASLCCEDRPELFTELNQVLSSLNLKTIRAEMSTLGGRIQGVLVVSGENNSKCGNDECAVFLRDALKGIVNRSSGGGGGSDERLKRRRRVFDSSC